MRQGELLALRWEDVTLNEATVFVHRNVTQGTEGGLVEKGTKTATGERRIVLPSATVASLRRWQTLVPSEAGSLVFTNSDHSWIKKDNLMHRGFWPLLRDAGLADVTFHSLRHSHASLLISKGVNIKTISERLGHKSIQVTLDTYGHLMPVDQERCAAVYDTLISGKALRAVS
jgi:integrase